MTKTPDNKQLRTIGHKLKPVVTIGGKGLSDTVMAELERALSDHELIKVKLAVGERDTRKVISDEICQQCGAQLVQTIGKILLIYRPAPKPKARLSNLTR